MSVLALLRIKHLTHTPDGRKLTPSEKGVLMQIADDHNEDRGYAWPSIANLALRVGLSDKQCRRVVQRLEKDKVIQSRPHLRDDNFGRLANDYRFWFDKPFDAASTAKTEKRLRLQASQAAGRPRQMKFEPTPTGGRGGLPPMSGGDGHGREGDTPTDGRGVLPSVGGQATTDQRLDLSPEATAEINENPPTPQGVKTAGEDSVAEERKADFSQRDLDSWTWMVTALKSELASVPANVAARFPCVKAGQNDFDACFRAWWLLSVKRSNGTLELETQAEDVEATQAGLAKYRERVERLARTFFRMKPYEVLTFVVKS